MVDFTGLKSVRDRTIFVNKGLIAKKPIAVITGNNLQILSEVDVYIPTGSFSPSQEDYFLQISGSLGNRNDGLFIIERVLSPTNLRLKNASFNVVDETQTTEDLIELANNLREKYEFHRTQFISTDDGLVGVHGSNDLINVLVEPNATSLSESITLLNDIRSKFESHRIDQTGSPDVHPNLDDQNIIFSPEAADLNSAIHLANEMRKDFDLHRQDSFYHNLPDVVNSVVVQSVKPTRGTFPGDLTGPFDWTLLDPQYGRAADSPYDVNVRVNGSPAVVDAVIGQLGAVVLEESPDFGDDVKVDYSIIKDPPQKFLRLNSPEFNLNQFGNNNIGGIFNHLYNCSSYLIDPDSITPDFMAPATPKRIGWKYKAIERAYSAVLNDPTTLLLNVPTNRISFSVLEEDQSEITVFYDPFTLPQDATDSWIKQGNGEFSLESFEKYLVIIDNQSETGPSENPPFFSHALIITSPSIINSAFRARVLDDELITDGVFTGVAFGITDGLNLIQVGFLVSDAVNLSSAIYLANSVKAAFNLHIFQDNVHDPDDSDNFINIVDASDLDSLVELSNQIKLSINDHFGSGPADIHNIQDVTNVVSEADASDLDSAIILVNSLKESLNSHLTQTDVHFLDDGFNSIDQVRQVGILKNTGPSEFSENWESFAIDWREFTTYRVFRDANGDASVFVSGDISPSIQLSQTSLPNLSDVDLDVNIIQQVFFGSVSRESESVSNWQFIRATLSPIESKFIERNKAVEYDASVIPQLDIINPWIPIGNGGYERITSPTTLLLDSTAGASSQEVDEFGLATSSFRGYLRLEPIQSSTTTTSLEFEFSSDFYTHSIDNQALGVLLDDDIFTIQLSFLQFTPSAATTTGTVSQPYSIINGDELVIRIADGTPKLVTFSAGDTTSALAVTRINTAIGFNFASSVDGKVKLTSQTLGLSSSFEIISGSAISKLGISPGVYFGSDSNPEPKVSWFGEDFPDRRDPPWQVGGSQTSQLLGRQLRILDTSNTDFLTYSQVDPIVTNQAISSNRDWKLNFRFNILSFAPGDVLPTAAPYADLNFAGLLVNVDEGPTGKNLEVHLSVDGADTYINLVSFDFSTGNLNVISQYASNWNDGGTHSISVFTNKNSNQILVLFDGITLSPVAGPAPTYSLLFSGLSGPSITFGSGAIGANNVDLSSSQSVCDWEAVNIFRDNKIGDPSSADRRFIGLYTGGAVDSISSYLLYQIDWSNFHTYRIIRDPVTSVSVYVDGANVPVITTSYDTLSLPPVGSSYLQKATNGRADVSFGAFNPTEISRSRWTFVNYSIGKLTDSELLIPPHNLLNQHNVISSPEHLRTNIQHTHHGFTVYSGGTPQDDFVCDPDVEAYTQLNEGTPPVPMTQDLTSRGGLIKTATPLGSVPTLDFVDFPGGISNFENDTTNVIEATSIVDLTNELKSRYNNHISSETFHDNADVVNNIVTADSNNIASAVSLLNEIKVSYNLHRVETLVHTVDDVTNVVTAADATDLDTSIVLANEIKSVFDAHIVDTSSHLTFDQVNTIAVNSISDALSSVILLTNDIKEKYLGHLTQTIVHLENDSKYNILAADATDLNSAIALANSEKDQFNNHRTAIIRETQRVHITDDSVNSVSVGDAVDIDTLTNLAIDIKEKYEAHRTQTDVHAASVFIRLNAPTRVVYDNIKFWTTEEGDSVPLAPYCDMSMIPEGSGITNTGNFYFSLPGTELPEAYSLEQSIRLANELKSVFNLHRVEAGVHPTDDTVNIVVSPDATDLVSLITLLNELKEFFNSHLVESGVHVIADTINTIITVDATDLGTSQALVNQIRYNYEQHRQDAVFHSIADTVNITTVFPTTSPSNPGWQLFSEGGTPDVGETGSTITFGTSSPMQTMYRHDNIMPRSSSVDFEFSIRMRINSFATPVGDDYDSRIYAGFTSDMLPGVAAAVGFELIGGTPAVKIHDVNSDIALARKIDEWRTAGFRTYKIIRNVELDQFQLEIE